MAHSGKEDVLLVLQLKRNKNCDLFLDGEYLGSLMILQLKGDAVRVGFDMPRKVKILRRELVEEAPPREVQL